MSRRNPRRGARVDTPVERLSEKQTLEHYKAVQIEDIVSKMNFVLEYVSSVEERFDGRLCTVRSELVGRIERLEAVIQKHSVMLRRRAKHEIE